MRNISFIIALFIAFVSINSIVADTVGNFWLEEKLKNLSNESLLLSSSSSSSSTTTSTSTTLVPSSFSSSSSSSEIGSNQVTTEPSLSTSLSPQSTEDPPTTTSRRQITYDQRQEGQYNIRADLENFMIVVIPPNPVAGVNLLDLLTRSTSLKRSSSKKNKQKKHNNLLSKYNRPNKNDRINNNNNKNGYLSRTYLQHSQMNNKPLASGLPTQQLHHQQLIPMEIASPQYSDFIEGRTPYRVDISSNENDFPSRIQHTSSSLLSDGDPQVDVLPPPPFPLHLQMKPFHLEAESPTIIQPTSLIQGKLMEFFNRINKDGERVSKSIRDHSNDLKQLHSNSVLILGEGRHNDKQNKIDDYNNDDQLRSTIFDSINLNDGDDDDNDDDNDDDVDGGDYTTRTIVELDESDGGGNNNWELKLIGATEQCGPDGKRDNYGICRYVPNLN